MGKIDIVQILMARDEISKKDAINKVNKCSRRLQEEAVICGDYEAAVDIIEEELGLEPDYMMGLL